MMEMRLSTLQKSGGTSLILGSVLLLTYSILFPFLLPMNAMLIDFTSLVLSPNWIWLAVVAFAGVLLMIFGFAAVYTKLFAESGLAGLLGFIFIEVAYIFQACKLTWEIFLWPVIASHQASLFLLQEFVIKNSAFVVVFRWIASITILLGILLFCVALLRSKNFPKLGGILVFLGAFMYGLGPLLSVTVAMAGILILSIGCTIIGLKLIKTQTG
jgi:hypothetical protein